MGKFKHYIRSMRSRFSPPRSTASNSSSLSSTTESRSQSADTNIHGGSSTTIFTSVTSYSQILTPSPTPTIFRHPRTETMSAAPTAFPPKERNAGAQRISLDAYAVLEVDIALLEFKKKLPLEELRMIGRGPAFSHFSNYGYAQDKHDGSAPDDVAMKSLARSETVSLASTISDSPSSCVWNTLRRAGHDQTQRQCRVADAMAGEDEARTLSLNTMGSDWAWEFAGFSGWHIDGKSVRGGVSSRGGVRSGGDGEANHSPLEDHRYHASHEASLQTSDDQRELTASRSRVGTSDGSSPPTAHLERAPSFTLLSADSCDLFLESIGLPILDESLHRVDDEDFEALPDWSDVEDDPEYNEFVEEQFRWSATNSSCSSNPSMQELPIAFPKLCVPSSYFNTATRTSGDVTELGSVASQLEDGSREDMHVTGKA